WPKQTPLAASQVKAPQEVAIPARHMPLPSQKRGATVESPWHVRGAHKVVLGQLRQAPLPSQKPSRPQLSRDEAAHSLKGSLSAAMGRHSPFAPGSAQERQAPLQS